MRNTLIAVLTVILAAPAGAQFRIDKQDVSFMSGDLRLAGTLYTPKGARSMPAVVLIHGSGQTDRSSMEYFAKAFAEVGVAALAYDKRGVGKSQGPPLAWRNYNFDDLAGDAAAGVAWLRSRPGIDTTRVGVFGASQGGWIAPLAAKRAANVRFLVLVSASVSTVAADNLFERAARLKHEGFTDAEVADARTMHVADLNVSRTGQGFDDYARLWNENKTKRWFARVYLDAAPAGPEHAYRQWYRTVMDVDPVTTLRDLAMPILWLFGDPALDNLSPVRQSMAALDTLRAAGKPYEVHTFPGADHSLQIPRGKEAPFRPVLAEWLQKTVGLPRP